MTALAKLIPVTTLLVLALLCLLPWGLGEALGFVLPVLPFAVVHFWMREHAWLLPPVLVFAVALAIDVLTFGPLGYWPIVYLAGLGLAGGVDRLAGPLDGFADWLAFAGVAAGACGVAWALASAYFARRVEPWPMLVAWGVLVLAWPLVVALLSPLARLVAGPRVLNLDRRR